MSCAYGNDCEIECDKTQRECNCALWIQVLGFRHLHWCQEFCWQCGLTGEADVGVSEKCGGLQQFCLQVIALRLERSKWTVAMELADKLTARTKVGNLGKGAIFACEGTMSSH